mgnify:CR=1 FL=1
MRKFFRFVVALFEGLRKTLHLLLLLLKVMKQILLQNQQLPG